MFTDVAPDMRIAQEEIFGPVTSVIPAKSLDEAIEIANGVRYGLSAAIYTSDVNQAFRAMNEMYTGIFYVNASTIGAEVHLPFGGTKATGNGHREAGTQVLEFFRNGSRSTLTTAASFNARRLNALNRVNAWPDQKLESCMNELLTLLICSSETGWNTNCDRWPAKRD